LFKISEVVIHLNVCTNESLLGHGQQRKSIKAEISDEFYPGLKAIHHAIMSSSLTLNPWVASRLIARHVVASQVHYRKFQDNSPSISLLSSLAVTKNLPKGLLCAWQSIDSVSSLEEMYRKGVVEFTPNYISEHLEFYDTDAPALGWWSDLAALEFATMVSEENINIFQQNWAELRRTFRIPTLR
jgi:hypothetical protein